MPRTARARGARKASRQRGVRGSVTARDALLRVARVTRKGGVTQCVEDARLEEGLGVLYRVLHATTHGTSTENLGSATINCEAEEPKQEMLSLAME